MGDELAPNFDIPGSVFSNTVGPDIASAATIAPTALIHRVTGTTQIDNITVPYTGFKGMVVLIPTAAWTTGAGGNIQRAITAVAGKVVLAFYHPDQAKWHLCQSS